MAMLLHEHAGVAANVSHPDAIAENRAAGKRRRRVDRDDAHATTRAPYLGGELRHERRLAAAGHAGDADDVRAARVTEDRLQRRPALVVRGLGARQKPRDRPRFAGENAGDEIERRHGGITRAPKGGR